MISNRIIIGASGNFGSSDVKSVIFDIATNWGNATQLGIRSIEFRKNSNLIALTNEFTAYATTNNGAQYLPSFTFNTSLSKTGSWNDTQWLSDVNQTANTNQRLIIVFDTIQDFDEIVINNAHSSGSSTSAGARQVKITTSPNSVTDTVYNSTVVDGTVLNDTEWPIHPISNITDNQIIYGQAQLPPSSGNSTNVKSVIFEIEDNWGHPEEVGVRSIEFKNLGSLITMSFPLDFSAYSTTQFGVNYNPGDAFDTGKSKTGGGTVNDQWLSANGSENNQRLIIVFTSVQTFDEIVINNYHASGTQLDRGARNVRIITSTDSITNPAYYESITNGSLLSISEWSQHVGSDTVDDQTVWTQP